jgi:hypothetical protein
MPNGTGADINGTVACPTNFIGGTPGLGTPGTAPWTVEGTESDRLNNKGNSPATPTFGTDYDNPSIRRGIEDLAFPLIAAYGGSIAAPVDSVRFQPGPGYPAKAVGEFGEFRAEYLDDRAGFYNAGQPDATPVAAQSHHLSHAGHLNPAGICQIGSGTPGATFVTDPQCGFAFITVGTPGVRSDGWQPGMIVQVPLPEGYYGYKTYVWDAAGNQSATLFDRVLINNQSPFSTGLGVPATLTATVFSFAATHADSAEVAGQSLELQYPLFPTTTMVRYSRETGAPNFSLSFDDVISSPLGVSISPTHGAPYARGIESTDATAFPGVNVVAYTPLTVKPTAVTVWSWNFGSLFAGGPAPSTSPVIPIPPLNVQNGTGVAAWNLANPTLAVNHWRVISTISTSNQFGSTTPLRAQVASPTNSPNAPFARVDFYRLDAVNGYWNYLGSDATGLNTDQGTYRSWLFELPNTSFKNAWNTSTAQARLPLAMSSSQLVCCPTAMVSSRRRPR